MTIKNLLLFSLNDILLHLMGAMDKIKREIKILFQTVEQPVDENSKQAQILVFHISRAIPIWVVVDLWTTR